MKRNLLQGAGVLARTLFLAISVLVTSAAANAAVYVSVALAPPLLPVYEQPLIPGPGYLWTPGYWAWAPDGYYWVPGTWVLAPFIGALWTPGYWGWNSGLYYWHPGYWGRHVGFYGGIDYGFGYTGFGYHGGYWRNRSFTYNRAVNNINVTTIRNTYNTTVVSNGPITRASFNGGAGGVIAQASAQERIAERERHVAALPIQLRHQRIAGADRAQFASVNHGNPALAAVPRVARFGSGAAVPARESSRVVDRPQGAKPLRPQEKIRPLPQAHPQPQMRPEGAMRRAPSQMRPEGAMRVPSQMRPEGAMRRASPRMRPESSVRPQGAPRQERERRPAGNGEGRGPGERP